MWEIVCKYLILLELPIPAFWGLCKIGLYTSLIHTSGHRGQLFDLYSTNDIQWSMVRINDASLKYSENTITGSGRWSDILSILTYYYTYTNKKLYFLHCQFTNTNVLIAKVAKCLSIFQPYLENGSDQLVVTLRTLSIHPAVHNQLIRTLFEGRSVSNRCLIEPFFYLIAN